MKRRILTIMMSAALAAMPFTGCGSSSAEMTESATTSIAQEIETESIEAPVAYEEASAEEPAPDESGEDITQVEENPEALTSEEKALEAAKNYLAVMGMSHQGIINQLLSEYGDQFTLEAATYAADNCGADWNAEALRAAQSYIELTGISYQGLINLLSSEYADYFTPEQATYAADNCGADWNNEALQAAQSYVNAGTLTTRDELIQQLTGETGDLFTAEQAEFAVSQLGL